MSVLPHICIYFTQKLRLINISKVAKSSTQKLGNARLRAACASLVHCLCVC